MYESIVRWGAAIAAGAAGVVFACAISRAPAWLEAGGHATTQSPEFFWATEARRIALPFKPQETRMVTGAESGPVVYQDQVVAAHAADRARALMENRPDREFAEYERGAEAFHRQEYVEAAKLWEGLLAWPAEERRYRSVWAAYMLGKAALRQKQPEAVKWFQLTRQLAQEGYADSLGLAADSYGWEAKSELDNGNLEKAAPLYLTQLAMGDDSAIVSLKLLVGGTAGFPPMMPEGADEAQRQEHFEQVRAFEEAGLARAAQDPLLRRITSAHVLAVSAGPNNGLYGEQEQSYCHNWLKAVEKAKLKDVDDADQMGWVAYTAGDYQAAARWLNLFNGETATSLWLQSKLLRREGQLTEAAKLMARVIRLLGEDHVLKAHGLYGDRKFVLAAEGASEPLYSAGGDLGTLHLSRGDFMAALEAFVEGGLDEDAAYVEEQVLTADELKPYVDRRPWSEEIAIKMDEVYLPEHAGTANLRRMLARHLVRAKRYKEAMPYLTPHFRAILTKYVDALQEAQNTANSKLVRARAYFEAAEILRHDGMDLIGTYDQPYRLNHGHAFPPYPTALEREYAKVERISYEDVKPKRTVEPLKLHVSVTAAERKRLASRRMAPGKPKHYLYTAAAHGWSAAQLLPDHSDELADVLNTCGRWIQNDAPAADKFFQAIERRAWKTEIGKAAGARHWFVTQTGPWSGEAQP